MKSFALVLASAAACLILSSHVLAASDKPTHLFRAVYFVPTNRTPQDWAIKRIKKYVKLVQGYYSSEMARNGFYEPGTAEGKTFAFDADENGEPIVIVIRGKHDDLYYEGGLEQFPKVAEEVAKAVPQDRNTTLVFTECHRMLADSSVTGPCCLGAAGEGKGSGGMAILGSDAFPFLDSDMFSDTRPVEELVLPELGPYPIKHGVSYGGFAGKTVGSYASTVHGATSHELGHGFYLPHVFVDDFAPKIGGDLMGRGNQGFRGNYGDYPGEWAHICKWNCEILAVSPYFNPGKPYTDKKPPREVVDVRLVNATSAERRVIRVTVKASDPSGLWRNIAIISPPWSTIYSAPFDEEGVARYEITPNRVPFEQLKPRSYNLETISGDMQGNWTLAATWVPVPETVTVQHQCPEGWADVPHGCSSPTGTLRLVAPMTALEACGVTLELEVRRVDEPFTGRPTAKSAPAAFADKPVEGVVGFTLPAGSYHWQYRLSTDNGKRSCWIVVGSGDQPVTDLLVRS